MLTEVSTFLKANSNEVILVVISVVLTFGLTLASTLISTPKPLRRAWKHKTRLKRLREQLERHNSQREFALNRVASTVRVALGQIAVTLLGICFLTIVFVWGGSDLIKIYVFGCVAMVAVMVYWLFYAYTRLGRLTFPNRYRKKLESKIKLLEERGY